jgi:transmembrane sensor
MAIPPISKRLQKIARNYLKGNLNASDQQEMDEWFSKEEQGETIIKTNLTRDEHRRQILASIHLEAGIVQSEARVTRLWIRVAAAASVLLMLSFGAYFVLHQEPVKKANGTDNTGGCGPWW